MGRLFWFRPFSDRILAARAIVRHLRRVGILGVVLGIAIAALQWWRDEGPAEFQPPLASTVLGWLPWWAWLIVALILALVSLFEGAYREIRRLEAMVLPMPTTQLPPVEKGLLDFQVEAEDAGKSFPRVMGVLTKDTQQFNTKLLRRSAEWQRKRGNVRKQRQIGSRLAGDIIKFADRIDQQVVAVEEQGRLLTEGMLGTIKHELIRLTEVPAMELDAVRDSMNEMLKSAKQGRGGITKFREAVRRVRGMNMSQDLNAALEQRLVPALERVIETIRGFENRTAQIVRTIDERRRGLRKSASRKAGRQPQAAP